MTKTAEIILLEKLFVKGFPAFKSLISEEEWKTILLAMEAYAAQQFRSQPETESKSADKILRQYGQQVTTPEGVFIGLVGKEAIKALEEYAALRSQPESKISHLFHLLNPEKEPPTEDGTYWSFSPRTCSIDKVHFHDGKFWEHHNILPCFPEFWIKGLCDVVALRSQPETEKKAGEQRPCNVCNRPIGNTVFTVCDDCWNDPKPEDFVIKGDPHPRKERSQPSQQSNTVPTDEELDEKYPSMVRDLDGDFEPSQWNEEMKAALKQMRSRMLSVTKEEAIGFKVWYHTECFDPDDYYNQALKSQYRDKSDSELYDLYLSTKTPTTKP